MSDKQAHDVTCAARLDQHRDRGENGERGGEDDDNDGVVRPGAAQDAEVQRQVAHQVERSSLLMKGNQGARIFNF